MNTYSEAKIALKQKSSTTDNSNLKKWCNSTVNLLDAIEEKEIEFNSLTSVMERLPKLLSVDTKANQIRSVYSELTTKCMKEFGYTTPKYYTTQWMVLGMTIFGAPFGLIFALALDSMAFFGIGLPIGMPIGLAVGAAKDKKAAADGKVLNI